MNLYILEYKARKTILVAATAILAYLIDNTIHSQRQLNPINTNRMQTEPNI